VNFKIPALGNLYAKIPKHAAGPAWHESRIAEYLEAISNKECEDHEEGWEERRVGLDQHGAVRAGGMAGTGPWVEAGVVELTAIV
jgi:hypothetical protein